MASEIRTDTERRVQLDTVPLTTLPTKIDVNRPGTVRQAVARVVWRERWAMSAEILREYGRHGFASLTTGSVTSEPGSAATDGRVWVR